MLHLIKLVDMVIYSIQVLFFFSSRRRHTIFDCDWSSDVCSSDLGGTPTVASTTIKSGSEPPGTPAAPTAVITLSTSTTACVPRSRETPNTCARNSTVRSEEHTSELQSQSNLVCRLLLEKKKNYTL